MLVQSPNFENSQMYMVSWTSTVLKSLSRIDSHGLFGRYKLIDIGCGKGKVLLLARRKQLLGSGNENYIGIDFESRLVEIARQNSKRMFRDQGIFHCKDILDFSFADLGENLVFFLYNPFDSNVMRQFLQKIANCRCAIIYVNPVHSSILMERGFIEIEDSQSWHPNLCFKIFINKNLKEQYSLKDSVQNV
jgi:SAM-dependent methyltransferase